MGDFAIVGEGITDQTVLRNVLFGFFESREPEPLIVFEQPPLDTTGAAGMPHPPGGWTLVVRYLRERKYLQALQLHCYVVIQIDTDIADDLGVPRLAGLGDEDFIELVVARLCSYIASEDLQAIRDRLLFAIGLDEIECWLLPLVFDRSEKKLREKVTGCLEAINHKLKTSKEQPLSTVANGKDPRRYERVSAPFRKRRKLDEAATNPGLVRFLADLGTCILDEPEGETSPAASAPPASPAPSSPGPAAP
jgi:hypothetical protein